MAFGIDLTSRWVWSFALPSCLVEDRLAGINTLLYHQVAHHIAEVHNAQF